MIVCAYSIHEKEPRVTKQLPGRHRWQITFYATDGEVRETRITRNKQPALLSEMLECAADVIDELITTLPAYTDAGFQVQLLR